MSMPQIDWQDIIHVGTYSQLQEAIDTAKSTGLRTRISLTNNISVPTQLIVPYGVTIRLESEGANRYELNAGKNGHRIMFIRTITTEGTIIALNNIRLTGGQIIGGPFDRGGAILSDDSAYCDILIEANALIDDNEAPTGGAIYVYSGRIHMGAGLIENNTASNLGGAIYCDRGHVLIYGGVISGNHAGVSGGGIYTCDFTMRGGTVTQNTAAVEGGGVYISNGVSYFDGDSVISENTAATGGGVYFTTDTNNNMPVSGQTRFVSNTATGDGGGAIGIPHDKLQFLHISGEVRFIDNTAPIGYANRWPADDAIYEANILIGADAWSNPFRQGYNNFDIRYDGRDPVPPPPPPPPLCRATTQRSLDVCASVSVMPFARVSGITTRCCGPVIIEPGLNCQGEPITSWDFTVRQSICVEVPVEFGADANVGVLRGTWGEVGCPNCPEVIG